LSPNLPQGLGLYHSTSRRKRKEGVREERRKKKGKRAGGRKDEREREREREIA
jgi:hypothetical protein